MSIEDLRRTLHEHADDAPHGPGAPVTAHQRTTAVLRRAAVHRRRRAAGATTAACAVAGVVGLLMTQAPGDRPVAPAVTSASPTPTLPSRPAPSQRAEGTATPTPAPGTYAGWTYPSTLQVDGRSYRNSGFGYEGAPGRRSLRVLTEPSDGTRALAWSTTPSTTGRVTVSVDGVQVATGRAGRLSSGPVLAAGRGHTVVVRADGLAADQLVGLVIYDLAE